MDLGNIRPQMEVVGSDGQHLGTVDHVEHNRIKLRRNDPAAGGQHHWLPQHLIARAEGNTVHLGVTAEEARRAWQGEAATQSPTAGDRPAGMGDPATRTGGPSMPHAPDTPGTTAGGEPGPRPGRAPPETRSRDRDREGGR